MANNAATISVFSFGPDEVGTCGIFVLVYLEHEYIVAELSKQLLDLPEEYWTADTLNREALSFFFAEEQANKYGNNPFEPNAGNQVNGHPLYLANPRCN